MDAISFVLGVNSKSLRSSNLKELIYRAPTETKATKGRKCYVSITFKDEEERADHPDRKFTRIIDSNGGSTYKVDNNEVSQEVYSQKLRGIGVDASARNFLVFQGDVQSTASKTPKDLTALIEKISGSDEYKKGYEDARTKKEQLEDTVMFAFNKKKSINAERKQYKEQKEEAENFKKLQEEQVCIFC